MNTRIDASIPAELRELVITRTFDAPRELVWKAFTEPQHLAAWWGPHGFDAPHPAADLRAGGKMNLDMRDPDGNLLPNPTVIREVKPPQLLSIVSTAFADPAGVAQLEVMQTFTFEEQGKKTKLTIKAEVLKATAAALPALTGMKEGWTQTLDKFGEHLDLVRWNAYPNADETAFVAPKGEPVVVVARTYDAPREMVWRAITEPALRARWWGPAKYTNEVLALDVRPGGKWQIDQKAKDGHVFSFGGEFKYVMKPARLVDTFQFADTPASLETVTLFDEGNGRTRLVNVTRAGSVKDRDAAVGMGMEAGARESMERLAVLLSGLKLAQKADEGHHHFKSRDPNAPRKVTHATFVIERTFDAPAHLVFAAFADPEAKARWFGGPPGWTQGEKSMDFRVGGREVDVGGPPGGPTSRFDCRYYDIVPNQRIVYAYEMYIDDARISVSVATIELKPAGAGTRFVLTEMGAYLDGFDNPAMREEGTRHLVEGLARWLKQAVAA